MEGWIKNGVKEGCNRDLVKQMDTREEQTEGEGERNINRAEVFDNNLFIAGQTFKRIECSSDRERFSKC